MRAARGDFWERERERERDREREREREREESLRGLKGSRVVCARREKTTF